MSGPIFGMKMPRRVWSIETDRYLWSAYWRGDQFAEIAKAIGKSEDCVQSRIVKLKKQDGPVEATWEKQLTPRKCLCCRTQFLSEGIGNRVCASCKGSEIYAT